MAKQSTQFFPVGFRKSFGSIAPGDTTSAKALIAAGSNDSVLLSAICTSADASPNVVEIQLYDGTNTSVMATITVPALAGQDGGTASVDLLNMNFIKNGSLQLAAGTTLRARAKTTTSDILSFTCVCSDF